MTARILQFPPSRLAPVAAVVDRVAMHWLPAALWSAVLWVSLASAAVLGGAPLWSLLLVPFGASATLAAALLFDDRRSRRS